MKLLEMAAFKKQSWKQQNDLTNLCMLTLQIVILVGFSTFTYGAFTKGKKIYLLLYQNNCIPGLLPLSSQFVHITKFLLLNEINGKISPFSPFDS